MTILVMAHGARDPGKDELDCPPGLKIDFYADFDENLLFSNSLPMVASGSLGQALDSYEAPRKIPNYVYGALTSEQMGRYLQLDRTGLPSWFVGDDLPDNTALCTDFEACTASGAVAGRVQHGCDGVLGAVQRSNEEHLVILACRGDLTVDDEDQVSTRAVINEAGDRDTSHRDTMDEEVMYFGQLDQGAQERQWEAWPEDYKVILTTDNYIKEWADAYGAKKLLNSDGVDAFAAMYVQLGDNAKAFLNSDPEVKATLAEVGMEGMLGA